MPYGRYSERQISLCLAILLVLPIKANALFFQVSDQSKTVEGQQNSQPATDPSAAAPKPDSPEQSAGLQQDNQKPLGTAAAPELRPDGVPASTASGAAIAPIKQKRVRRFSVATALAIGAVVAVGVVVGLSAASPSKQ